jgi:hypothetical protein
MKPVSTEDELAVQKSKTTLHKKPSPEATRRCSESYYTTHADEVCQYVKEYA